jgi:staphylococcal nuclease domain-containing protein 1
LESRSKFRFIKNVIFQFDRGGEVEKRPFGTLSVGKHADIAEVLVTESLAVTQKHCDDDERSLRYDELLAAEAVAKAAKMGVHKEGRYKPGATNNLTDPRKAKAYSGSIMRAGSVEAVADYVFRQRSTFQARQAGNG